MKKFILLLTVFLTFGLFAQKYDYQVNLDHNTKISFDGLVENLIVFNRVISDSALHFQSYKYLSEEYFQNRAQSLGHELISYSITFDSTPSAHETEKAGTNCSDAELLCNNSNFGGNNQGFGVQELNGSNRGCLAGNEHYSSWYYLSIDGAGTLQMAISPTGNADYDFAIWGPFTAANVNSNCPPVSAPIRCSYASPPCVGSGCGFLGLFCCTNYNTGLGNGASDTSEGAGGDGWVAPLNVSAGQFYILLIDNWSSSTIGYSVNWGGTSTLGCIPIVLPVQLISFYATTINYHNHIKWNTLTETNNDYFTIEKSIDGTDWRKIHQEKGAVNSSESIEYKYIDTEVGTHINYYRLSQTDFNGEPKVLGIVSANNTNNRTLLKIVNLLGQEVDENYKGVTIEYYNDGSTEKVFR